MVGYFGRGNRFAVPGIMVLVNPVFGAMTIVIWTGAALIVMGLLNVFLGMRMRPVLIMIKLSLHNHFQVVMQIGSPIFIAFDIKNTIKMETSQQTYLSAQVLDYSVDPRLSAEVKAFLKHNSGSAPGGMF